MKPVERFSDRASDYAAGRPSYPDAAFEALFEGADPLRLTAVDLGAGTGISSRLLAARVALVIAVEPNAAMREQAEPMANLRWSSGTAEETGLDTGSCDVVCAFQAFHWFNYHTALLEMVRILRPGGRAAIVYNERDETNAFTAEYGALVRRYATDETEKRRSDGRTEFESFSEWKDVRIAEIGNAQMLDRDRLHARARSTSYVPHEGDAAERLHREIDALFDEHAVDGNVEMLLKTIVTTAFPFAALP
jgi:SAM-dependent methyltransferase